MIGTSEHSLMKAFNDPTFAWNLLEWEMAIEMNESLSGQAIAQLLELYMRGVEKMNSLLDIRQSYFKNKVTSLMIKSSVVKTLNKPPMAKEKPLEIAINAESTKAIKQNGEQQTFPLKQGKQPSPQIQQTNALALKERRREMEMRLAYEAETSSQQNLNHIYNQHLKKEESANKKIKGLLTEHQEKLKQRITKRKLRTATYRSRPQDTIDTFPLEQVNNTKQEIQQPFSPTSHPIHQLRKKNTKRYHSLECKNRLTDSPRKPRKNTHDFLDKDNHLGTDTQSSKRDKSGEYMKKKGQQKMTKEGKQVEFMQIVSQEQRLIIKQEPSLQNVL